MSAIQQHASDAHRASVQASISDVAAFLQDALGQKLVAYMAGVKDPKTVSHWVGGREPGPEASRRLRDAQYVFQLLLSAESDYTVRAWFVGLNPQLDDESPAAVIADGRTQEVLMAAKAFLAGG